MLKILLLVLAVTAVVYTVVLVRTAYRCDALGLRCEGALLGAVTNFFDTLGIGSFAPSTAWIKLRKLVPDSHIPGVLISGHALPTIAQALIYITLVEVDPVLLVVSIAASVAGALAGVPIALRLPVRSIQIIVGIALPLAGGLFAAANLGLMPAGGDARGLPPWLFGLALVGAFITGALMTVGIGFYSPLLAMFSLMGLNPVAVFPIMAGAGALMMPASALRFIKSDRIDLKLALSPALGGIPAVLVAACIVNLLPLAMLRRVVVAVVIYTGMVMLRTASRRARIGLTRRGECRR